MMRYDFHIHTEYCGHAPGMTVEVICRRAEELNLETIAITDHIYDNASAGIVEKIRQDLKKAPPKLPVVIGAEVDVDSDFTDGRLAANILKSVDYLIAGFHYVPTVGNYPWKPEHNSLDEPTFMRYWESTLLGIVSNPRIHTLAHPGRLLAAAVGPKVNWSRALKVFKKAAKLSAKNRIAWELNELTGRRLPPEFAEKWHEIYAVALDAGVKLIFGSDSHDPESIGEAEFIETLLAKLPPGSLSTPREILEWKKQIQ
ncbi:MAG: PHP domain-containing protein [Planctomycetes bacterium]|nr:PHP domain-containing protein [Planctomycetota bacterium]